jgi:hypothetical protein
MALSRLPLFLFLVILAIHTATALQVTPDSPCADVCIGAGDVGRSDPEKSETTGKDIACDDDVFASTARGRKAQACMTCLQGSTFTKDSESDQKWFLYNLRFSVNYCVLGFPNNTALGSNPCITSEACGPLERPLRAGLLEPDGADAYAYCAADDRRSLGDAYEKCLSCVHAGGSHYFLSNFLTALEAGCRQKPAPGTLLGLNATVFSTAAVGIVDPSAPSGSGSPAGLSTPVIAGIAVGAAAALLAIAGCVYMRVRRRNNRLRLSSNRRRRRASPLSFQCQTHLTPRDPLFQLAAADDADREKAYADPAAALGSNPVPVGSAWTTTPDVKIPAISVTTQHLPAPPAVHASPQRASPDDYASPQSATSTRSTAPLLHHHHHRHRPYVPSEYAGSPQQQSPATFSPVIPASSSFSPVVPPSFSPVLGVGSPAHRGSPSSPWEEQRVVGSGRNLTGRSSHWGVTTHIEATVFPTSFPPPPKR